MQVARQMIGEGRRVARPVVCSGCRRVIDTKTELIYGAQVGPICAGCYVRSGGTPRPAAPSASGSSSLGLAGQEPDGISFAPLAVVLVDFAWGFVVGLVLAPALQFVALFSLLIDDTGQGRASPLELGWVPSMVLYGLVVAGIPGLLGAIWRCELAGLVATVIGVGSGVALVSWRYLGSVAPTGVTIVEPLIALLVTVVVGYLAGCAIGLAGRWLVRGRV